MNSHSIRSSLLIRCGLGVGVLLCLLATVVYLLVERSLYRELDDALKEMAALLSNQVELENGKITHEWEEGMGRNPMVLQSGLFQFWNDRQGGTTRSPELQARDLPKFTSFDGRPLLRTILLPDGRRGRAMSVKVIPFVMPEEQARMETRHAVIDPLTLPHTLVVARDEEPLRRTLTRLRWILGTGVLGALGLGFLLVDRVVRDALSPLSVLAKEVRDRSEQHLDRALTVPDELPSELGGLATDFNSLLGRVAKIRQREKDFIRHAAHELRTPIAGLQATTDLALSQTRDAAAYRSHLVTCQKVAEELGELVQRLSALARIGQETDFARREEISLGDLIAEIQLTFESAVHRRELAFVGPKDDAVVWGDRALLRIILNNLFDNAISYAKRGGSLQLVIRRQGSRVELELSNPVEEMPEDVERLFEPLFRRESSRADAGAHLGIGLTLSRDAAATMGGALISKEIDDGRIAFILILNGV